MDHPAEPPWGSTAADPDRNTPPSRIAWWPAAAVAVLATVVFSPVLTFGFVYDALIQIVTDDFLFDPRHWFDVLTCRVLAMDVFDYNRPLQIASLMLDATLWGRNPFGYHLTSLLLHAANTALVWLVVRHLLRESTESDSGPAGRHRLLAAMAGTAIFAVHPVVAEAVCEPTYREDLLVAFFSLLSLLLVMRHRPAGSGPDAGRAVAVALLGLLAAAAKESAIAIPALLVAFWWCFRRQERDRFWPAVLGGTTATVIGFLALRFLLDPGPGLINDEKPAYLDGSPVQAVLILPRILAFYAQLIACPTNLCADYGGASIRHLSLVTALACLMGIGAAAALAARGDRRLVFAFALILLPLVPVSNLVPIFRPFADRFLYLPMAGIAATVACLCDAPALGEKSRRRAVLVALVAAAILVPASRARQRVWADSLALWTDTFAKNPGSFTAARNAAVALADAGRLDEAEKAAQLAIVLTDGQHATLWGILAVILDKKGQPTLAGRALEEALELPLMSDPDGIRAGLYMDRDLLAQYRALLEKRGVRPRSAEADASVPPEAAAPQHDGEKEPDEEEGRGGDRGTAGAPAAGLP